MTQMVEFEVNPHSKYPVHEQIKEQIRLAISLGHIAPGYALPSIRDLEKQLHVGRAVVLRAYRDLEASGIVALKPRKGVVVAPKLVLPANNHRAQKCEALTRKVIREVEKLGVLQSSFAAMLYQRSVAWEQATPPIAFVESIRTEAEECAAQVSAGLGTKVVAFSVDDFKRLTPAQVSFRFVLTPFYDFERIARAARKLKVEVAPVVLRFSTAFIAELQVVLDAGKALLILSSADYERHGNLLVQELKGRLGPERSRQLHALPDSEVPDIRATAASGEYNRLYVGNRIWDSLPDSVKQFPTVSRPHVEIDTASLQQAKTKLGMLI
jgi:DNA-binding transcriptional regulator YhcF (GntR family)